MSRNEKSRRSLWPAVDTEEQARYAARQGMWAAVIVAAVTAFFVALVMAGVSPLPGTTFDASALLDAAIFAALAWGIYKDSRLAAVSGLGLFLLERVFFFLETGPSNTDLILALALTLAFLHGVRGTFALHRLRTRANTAEAALTGEPLFR